MSFLFSADYYEVRKNGISPAQNMAAYLGGSVYRSCPTRMHQGATQLYT